MQYTKRYESPLGKLTMVSNGTHLNGLWFENQKYFSGSMIGEDTIRNEDAVRNDEASAHCIFQQVEDWLDCYFRGGIPKDMPPLEMHGSPFRLAVWEILKTIPYGEVITYGEIAKQIAKKRGIEKMSAQAIGGAVGHNPISIIVPCHRVVGQNGSLTGYGGGMDRKAALLTLEKLDMSQFSIPTKGTAL